VSHVFWQHPVVPEIRAQFYCGDRLIGTEIAAPPAAEATLWVNAATGDDDLTLAQVRAGGGTLAWETIGRAAWGSQSRSSPNTLECAQPGDVVSIAAGTYSFSGTIDDRLFCVYNPAISGTSSDPIRFVANGLVTLTAPSARAPVLGAADVSYIEWYADVTEGHAWIIHACPETPTGTDCTGALVRCRPDTGPVVFLSSTGSVLEGARITATRDSPLGQENWPAVRLESSTSCIVRNNEMRDFIVSGNTYDGHAACVNMYGCHDCLIEHNYGDHIGCGVSLKDSSIGFSSGNIIRFNLFERVGQAFAVSHVVETTTDEGSDFYQNIVNGYRNGIGGSGSNSDRFYNNTFYNGNLDVSGSFTFEVRAAANPGVVDDGAFNVKVFNNIVHTTIFGLFVNGASMPATTAIHFNRNCYFTFTDNFYFGNDGELSYDNYRLTHSTQDTDSLNSDPLFVNAAGGDFTLQGGSPAINLGRHPDTSAIVNAGAYITGDEVIGVDS
jgi:hypothetical protein